MHMHDSGLSDYSFRLGIILRSASGKAALAFYSQGVAHGTLGDGSRDSDERRIGQLATIRDDFEDFAAGNFTVVRQYQNDLLGWIESAFLDIATFLVGCVTLGAPAALLIYNATYLAERMDVRLPGELGLAGIILAEGAYFLCGAAVFIPVFIAGALVSAALFKRRPLSQKEIDEARTVFADTVPYDKVWVTNLETFGGRWFTNMGIDGSIVIGASSEYEDMVADPRRSRIFIHEMTHVWQIAHSPTLTVQCEGLEDRAREAVEGIDAVYGVDPNDLQPWDSYNWEQQGDLIKFAYRDRKAVPSKPLEQRPFERYIVENILTG